MLFLPVSQWFPDIEEHFKGEREGDEFVLIRMALGSYLGEMEIEYEETADLPYEIEYDKRKISGLMPMNIEEFIVFMLHTVELYLSHPLTSFVRDFVVKWSERSPFYQQMDRVNSFLDALGVK